MVPTLFEKIGSPLASRFYELVGGHTWCETPDPIPNSEAKAPGPMVVRKCESRSLPTLLLKSPVGNHGAFFLSLRELWINLVKKTSKNKNIAQCNAER